MEPMHDPSLALTFASWVLALVLDANEAVISFENPAPDENNVQPNVQLMTADAPLVDTFALFTNAIHNYRLCIPSGLYSHDVEFWVRPRSTTWFSRFLIEQYDDHRWLSMFRMTKASVFHLTDILKPLIEKKNTKYRFVVPVFVRVACTLFKLTHGANLTICSEFFAIGRSTVCKLLRDVVHAVNDTLREEMIWPQGVRIQETQQKFSSLCSLPSVVGAIDGTHIPIAKPALGAADYYYFKSGGYTMNCQAVVDSEKRFLNIFVGMPGSTNDSRMLRRSSLHGMATNGVLLDRASSVHGHPPVLLGDSGYPLLPWLMVPHKTNQRLSVSEVLFNKKMRKGRCVVENAFGILKSTFRELVVKTDLTVSFLPDVVYCCCLLHNVLLRQSHEEVDSLMSIIRRQYAEHSVDMQVDSFHDVENVPAQSMQDSGLDDQEEPAAPEGSSASDEEPDLQVATAVRANLGIYLASQRSTTG